KDAPVLDAALEVGEVGGLHLEEELPDAPPARARLEGSVEVRAADPRPGHEAQGGVEVLADPLPVERHVPEVVRVVELEAVGVVDLRRRLVVGAEREEREAQVPSPTEVRGREPRIDTDEVVVSGARGVPASGDGSDPGLLEEVPAHPQRDEVLRGEWTRLERRVAGLDVEDTHVEARLPARDLETGEDRDLLAVQEPDRAAEEGNQLGILAPQAGNVVHPGALEEERPLLREEELEAREVDLARVHLRLREIGVDGQGRRQAGRDALEDVEAGLELPVSVLAPDGEERSDV